MIRKDNKVLEINGKDLTLCHFTLEVALHFEELDKSIEDNDKLDEKEKVIHRILEPYYYLLKNKDEFKDFEDFKKFVLKSHKKGFDKISAYLKLCIENDNVDHMVDDYKQIVEPKKKRVATFGEKILGLIILIFATIGVVKSLSFAGII